jgi:hypothetical protein
MLTRFWQNATDVQVWRAFRSKRRITIASDGGLSEGVGSFGWKIEDPKHRCTLFSGAGPIDGPMEMGSSTRSELGGFTAPLLLCTMLAKYWGIRHRCKFRWVVDSKAAIRRVEVLLSAHDPSYQATYPKDADYITLIKELHVALQRPIKRPSG